jgi:23S rRNA (adenine2030-N6)-methyltransferase
MLSYRHAFHAGNHADVLKHFVLVQLLEYFNQKDKPYWYIDTTRGPVATRWTKPLPARTRSSRMALAVCSVARMCRSR